MRLKQQLLDVSAAYCAARGLSESRLSTILFGGGGRLKGLREDGKKMLSDNIEDALAWFSHRWPEGAEWPRHVPRPVPAPSAEPPAGDGG